MNGSGGVELFQKMLGEREARRNELRSKLEELEREIQAIQLSQRLYMRDHGIPEMPQEPLLEHGLSLTKRRERALKQWAERNDGILLPKEAKKSLIASGLLRPGKGAGWIVYGTLSNMDCWEKIEPGKYRLQPPTTLENEEGRPIGRLIPMR